MRFRVRRLLVVLASVLTAPLEAQSARDAVLAVVDSTLLAISRNDHAAFADFMLPEAVTFSGGMRADTAWYGSRTSAQVRARRFGNALLERGFDATVQVAGTMAVAWVPYDIYVDGAWSHCGVDVFTLFRVGSGWRIASMAWSVEQPPACRAHPDGPPRADDPGGLRR